MVVVIVGLGHILEAGHHIRVEGVHCRIRMEVLPCCRKERRLAVVDRDIQVDSMNLRRVEAWLGRWVLEAEEAGRVV